TAYARAAVEADRIKREDYINDDRDQLRAEIVALKGTIADLEADRLRRGEPVAQQPADDEVVFIDGVGAGRSSVKSCRDGVQWIMVGDRVYWPLSDSDAKRLHSACCGNGSFDGPATPDQEEE